MSNSKNHRKARTHFQYGSLRVSLAIIFGILLLVFGTVIFGDNKRDWVFWVFMILGLVNFGAAAEIYLERLDLCKEELRVTKNFKKNVIPKSKIEKVTWEKGSGVTLILKNGEMIAIPDFGLGSQGVVNSIRSWLKRY